MPCLAEPLSPSQTAQSFLLLLVKEMPSLNDRCWAFEVGWSERVVGVQFDLKGVERRPHACLRCI